MLYPLTDFRRKNASEAFLCFAEALELPTNKASGTQPPVVHSVPRKKLAMPVGWTTMIPWSAGGSSKPGLMVSTTQKTSMP
jgi:hypothetical protein